MHIALVTTLPGLEENSRLKKEALSMGHEFEVVNLKEFSFYTKDGKLVVDDLSQLKANIVIVRGIFLAIKTISAIVGDLRKKGVKVFDNNLLEHRYSIDKVTDLVKLSLAGIPIPETAYSRDIDDFPKMAGSIGYPVVVKTTRMGKGAHVYKIENRSGLDEFIEEIAGQRAAKGFVMQQFIDYHHDLRILIIGNKVFTMKRIPAEGEFRANFSLGGKVEEFDLPKDAEKLAIDALEAVGMTIGGVDMLINGNGEKYILEVNHTAGFVGMEEAVSSNIARIYLEHVIQNAH